MCPHVHLSGLQPSMTSSLPYLGLEASLLQPRLTSYGLSGLNARRPRNVMAHLNDDTAVHLIMSPEHSEGNLSGQVERKTIEQTHEKRTNKSDSPWY